MRRPFSVTILAWGVLSLTALQLIRVTASIQNWNILLELSPRPGPVYISMTGIVWAAIGSILFAGLWLGKSWARVTTLAGAVAFTAYYWLDRLIFQNEIPRQDWPFSLFINLLIFGYLTTTLIGSKPYFQRGSNDRKP